MRKVLLILPKPYKPKRFVIEESHDLDKYTLDQLLSSLSSFEIFEMDDIKKEEVALNVSKKPKDELEASEEMDELEENFIRRLQIGTKKYTVKLPFKCFNYGRIGHYTSRCMYKEDCKRFDDDERIDRYKFNDNNKKIDDRDKGKRGFCSMKTHLFEDDGGDDLNEEFLFLGIKEKDR